MKKRLIWNTLSNPVLGATFFMLGIIIYIVNFDKEINLSFTVSGLLIGLGSVFLAIFIIIYLISLIVDN